MLSYSESLKTKELWLRESWDILPQNLGGKQAQEVVVERERI
jgi:hypothetical protein